MESTEKKPRKPRAKRFLRPTWEIAKELQALEEVDSLLKEEAISLREAADYLFSLYGMTIL